MRVNAVPSDVTHEQAVADKLPHLLRQNVSGKQIFTRHLEVNVLFCPDGSVWSDWIKSRRNMLELVLSLFLLISPL